MVCEIVDKPFFVWGEPVSWEVDVLPLAIYNLAGIELPFNGGG